MDAELAWDTSNQLAPDYPEGQRTYPVNLHGQYVVGRDQWNEVGLCPSAARSIVCDVRAKFLGIQTGY